VRSSPVPVLWRIVLLVIFIVNKYIISHVYVPRITILTIRTKQLYQKKNERREKREAAKTDRA